MGLAAAPPALGARAAVPSAQPPGLLSLGAYDHALIQLHRGSLAGDGELVSRRLRLWRVPSATAQRILPRLLSRGVVEAVEPEQPVTPLAAKADPLVGLEWWRPVVGADRATPPGPGVPVTILDTGLDVAHQEFAARPNTQLVGTQNIAESPEDFHGTAVSSVVGAPENGVGIVGVYPQAALRSVDVRQLGTGDVVAALEASIDAGRSVINMSFGVPRSQFFEDAVMLAFGTGSIVVAAAGNEREQGSPGAAPANLNHVLTVAATDQLNQPTTFSSASLSVDLAAPGVDIPAAVPAVFSANLYELVDGTSFSAPIVAGATAWVWTSRSNLDNTQVFDLMRFSARDIGVQGFDRDTGFGLLDIPSALSHAAPVSDQQEPNDDIRHVRANGLFRNATRPITAPNRTRAAFTARLDITEDPEDVYRVYVPPRRTVQIVVTPTADVDVDLWKPGATSVFLRGAIRARSLFAHSAKRGRTPERVSVRNNGRSGFYAYLDVYLPRNGPLDAKYRVSVSTARR